MIATRIYVAVTFLGFATSSAFGETALPRDDTRWICRRSVEHLAIAPLDQSVEVDEQIQRAQKTLYGIASTNCSVVVETIAEDCKITGMTNNVDIQRGNNRDASISVRGQIDMAIKLKTSTQGSK
ncbi:hypothetical protein N2600_04275 [Rhizobium sp. WSM1274]|uniref:hypothetical protein n=1 Tax=Rhizobium sp. WSM1274 TaxID=3138254 RepID=UPI0021A443DE|nr:hypothetical protein [Rhizobium leguminosarum]UWU29193.1 hypothetical protein N2600_04275 [Rhizobium leguminosarum bv. viciae]